MPVTVQLGTNGVTQAAIVPDATQFNDGMMTPTMLRQLNALWDDMQATFEISRQTFIPFNSTVALSQTVIIPDATATSSGVITKAMVATLNALWLASGKTLTPAPRGEPATLKFDVNLACPQSAVLPLATFPLGGSTGGRSGAMTGEQVQKLGILANAGPPVAAWTEHLISAAYDAQKVWGFSPTEVYVSNRSSVWKFDGATWAPTVGAVGTVGINSLWGPSTGILYALGGIHIRRTTDGGATWADVPVPGGWGGGQSIWGVDANNLFITNSSGKIYQSTDAGATWNLIATDPDGDTLYGIWGFGVNDVYFSGGGDEVRHWNGAALTTIAAPTFNESSFAIWGAATGNVYWVTDVPALPRKQVNHAVGLTLFAETGPWITNNGGAPDDEVWGISGQNANKIWAVGFNNNGAKAYKISVPSNVAPGTWVLDALPADTDAGAQALQVWVDPVTGFVMCVGSRSNGNGVSWSKLG